MAAAANPRLLSDVRSTRYGSISAMEHQFVPRISLYRLQNAVFELRVHVYLPHNTYLAAADVELTRHGDCLLVSGNVPPPYVGEDYYHYGHEHVHLDKVVSQGTVVWTDQTSCGRFGRSVPIGLSPGTEYVILDRRVECGDYVVRYTLRNTPSFVGNACTSIGGNVSQHHLCVDAGFDFSAPVSFQAETHANAYHHLDPSFHSSQPFVPYHSQPTSTQALGVSYHGTNVGGVNASFGLNAGASADVGFSTGTGVNVQLGSASAQPNFIVGGNASGTADLATMQTVQVTQEATQSAIQQTTQTAAGLDIATGNKSGEGTLAGSSGQYDAAGFVSGQMQGQATEVTTLAGSEDVQLGSVVVTGQVVSGSTTTQAVGQVSSVQQTTQVAAEQAKRGVTTGQITQETTTTQSSTQAQVLKETTQSLTPQTTTELNAEFTNTTSGGLVNVTGRSSGKFVGDDEVTVGLNTAGGGGTGSTRKLEISAGAGATVAGFGTSASANIGLKSAGVSSGRTAHVTTDHQVTQQTTARQSAQTSSEIDGITRNTGSRRQVECEPTRGVGQLSQTTQTSTELDVETKKKGGLVTVCGPSAHCGSQVPGNQTQSSVQQSAQTSEIDGITIHTGSRQVAWKSTRGAGQLSSAVEQTTTIQKTSTELDVEAREEGGLVTVCGSSAHHGSQVPGDQMQSSVQQTTQSAQTSSEIDGITRNTGSRQVAWESTLGVGQLSSSVEQTTTQKTSTELDVEARKEGGHVTVCGSSAHHGGQVHDQTQSSVQQTTQSSTQQTMRTSADLDVRKEGSGTLVTVASSSGRDGSVSLRTQGEEVGGVTIINGGKEVQHELETGLEGWETTPFFSRQFSQASTDTMLSSDTMLSLDTTLSSLSSETSPSSTRQTKEISTELDVRTGNTSGIVTVAGYDGGASVQTQKETVGIAIAQGGEDVQCGYVTGQVSTQGVIQSSSVEQTIQPSSEETNVVNLEQAIRESIDSDIRKRSRKKAKEDSASDNTTVEENVKEEVLVPEITRVHSEEAMEYARRSESDQETV